MMGYSWVNKKIVSLFFLLFVLLSAYYFFTPAVNSGLTRFDLFKFEGIVASDDIVKVKDAYRYYISVKPDRERALVLLEKGASMGDAHYQELLANEMLTEMRDPKGVYWLEKAALSGSATAQVWLASLYEKGEFVENDYAKARAYYNSAADQAHIEAVLNLARMYVKGLGGEQDSGKALQLLDKARSLTGSNKLYEDRITALEKAARKSKK